MRMTVSPLIISFSWTMIFSISVWTSSSFNSVPLLQIAALTEEIENVYSTPKQENISHSHNENPR